MTRYIYNSLRHDKELPNEKVLYLVLNSNNGEILNFENLSNNFLYRNSTCILFDIGVSLNLICNNEFVELLKLIKDNNIKVCLSTALNESYLGQYYNMDLFDYVITNIAPREPINLTFWVKTSNSQWVDDTMNYLSNILPF